MLSYTRKAIRCLCFFYILLLGRTVVDEVYGLKQKGSPSKLGRFEVYLHYSLCWCLCQEEFFVAARATPVITKHGAQLTLARSLYKGA